MIDNEFVKKAEDELEYINSNEEERARARFREKAEWNYNAAMKSMYAEGRTDGIKEGIREGIKEGIKEGIREGAKEQNIKIAKKMLEQKLDIEIIMNTTGLSKEEIEKIRN